MDHRQAVKIVVRTERRPDGGLRAWSDDVPGLVLSGADPVQVMADLKPAIELIVSEMLGREVTAHELVAMPDRGRRAPTLAGLVEHWVARLRPERREFSAAPCTA